MCVYAWVCHMNGGAHGGWPPGTWASGSCELTVVTWVLGTKSRSSAGGVFTLRHWLTSPVSWYLSLISTSWSVLCTKFQRDDRKFVWLCQQIICMKETFFWVWLSVQTLDGFPKSNAGVLESCFPSQDAKKLSIHVYSPNSFTFTEKEHKHWRMNCFSPSLGKVLPMSPKWASGNRLLGHGVGVGSSQKCPRNEYLQLSFLHHTRSCCLRSLTPRA